MEREQKKLINLIFNMQTIIIKLNKIKYRMDLLKEKKFYLYSLHRNKKCLMTGQAPLCHRDNIKLHLATNLFEQLSWEIEHELEKIKL